MAGFDPTEEWSAIPATGEESGRRKPGKCRFVADLPPDLVAKTMKESKRRRVPMARLVEDALRAALSAEGVAVMLAALLVGTTGCHEAPAVGAAGSSWDAMVWDSGRWGGDDGAEVKPCTFPADLPCRMGAPDTGGQ